MPESTALQALLQTAAFAPIANRGWLKITGEDRTRWLNGMTTNNIATLQPGEGCYTFFLNAQGKIQADAYAFAQADSILLQTANPTTLAAMLDKFIIMDDVELETLGAPSQSASSIEVGSQVQSETPNPGSVPQAQVTPLRAGLSLTGPDAESLLTNLNLTPPQQLHLTTQIFDSELIDLLRTHSPLTPAFEIWSDPATIGLLTESLRHAGALEATPEALTQFRILSGTPLYGTDIRDRDLPQETAQTRALHFTKGCYLGQEIVERIHSRGAVHRTFTGFVLTGDLPPAGTLLTANEKPAGELTSITTIGNRTIALGYLRREALPGNQQTHAPLTFPNGTATPHSLPLTP